MTTPLSGTICHPCAETSNCTPNLKSSFTHYEDMKGNEKCRNWVVLGLGVTQGHRQCHHLIEHIRLPLWL